MKIAYPVFIKKRDNEYLVYVPDFDAYTEGTDFADAISMARDAIACRILSVDPPVASDYASAMRKAKADADEDFDFSDGVLTLVDIDTDEYRCNLYAELIEMMDFCADYWWGYDPDNMRGMLQIDLREGTYKIYIYPDGPRHIKEIESFADMILQECLRGNVGLRFSREIE